MPVAPQRRAAQHTTLAAAGIAFGLAMHLALTVADILGTAGDAGIFLWETPLGLYLAFVFGEAPKALGEPEPPECFR